jgi:membrane dipeptidase
VVSASRRVRPDDVPDQTKRLHQRAPLTDVHVHPSLKAYLFKRNLWRHFWSGKAWDPFSSRSDFKMLEKGGLGVIWAAHYLPERELFSDCRLIRYAASLFVPDFRRLVEGSLFERTLEMMSALEREIGRRPDRVELARSAADVIRIREHGKLAVVHAIEGSHILEGNLDNLEALADRGVAMLTLAHFYPNGVAAHVDGLPEGMFIRKLCGFEFGAGGSPPLTDFGRALLGRLKALPMLVDVTHCTPEARAAVYAELGGERPLMASHVGVARHNRNPYNLGDEEIREIARSGGAVGVIFMTYWLDSSHPKDGLASIWKTIEHVHNVTGSWDHIVLGSDFDGFTDPPDDLRDSSSMGRVTGMLLERGVPEDDVMKILGGNAQRVLQAGWR